jgi:hypothetical protein
LRETRTIGALTVSLFSLTHQKSRALAEAEEDWLAIALSKRGLKAWERRAAKKDIWRHGTIDNTTCIMAIDLKVLMGNSFECITFFSVYALSTYGNTGDVVKAFWMELENEITRTPKDSIPIVGGDIKAMPG